MKIVIDIAEGMLDELRTCKFPIQDAYRLCAVIENGTPLPEGVEILTKEAYSDLCLRASHGRRTGKWIAQKVANSWSDYKCSECGRILTVLYSFGDIPTVSDVANDYPFCHCGAKMEGAKK